MTETEIEEITGRLKAMGDRAYCQMIDKAQSTPCLGWEAKVRAGQFGEPELLAHTQKGELYGRHAAFYEAATLVAEALRW